MQTIEPKALVRLSWFLILFGVILQLSYVFASREALPHRPFEEDTFFHMAVTRNIAMGKGITIDGVTPTSGAQPGTFIYTVAHLLGHFDKWQALRWARALDVAFGCAAAVLIFRVSTILFSEVDHP